MAISRISTKFGTVFRADQCKSDYDNIITSTWYRRKVGKVFVPFKKRPVPITLQRPAMDAFRRVEEKVGFQVFVTGSLRTCATQLALWKSDQNRYAHPNEGVHTQGLAVDVDTAKSLTFKVKAAFREVGWKQSRPDDEPWHFSWGVEA